MRTDGQPPSCLAATRTPRLQLSRDESSVLDVVESQPSLCRCDACDYWSTKWATACHIRRLAKPGDRAAVTHSAPPRDPSLHRRFLRERAFSGESASVNVEYVSSCTSLWNSQAT